GTNSYARFYQPQGVALDSSTNLYVSDGGNNLVRKIRRFGTNWVTTTAAGSPLVAGSMDGTGSAARFSVPYGIAAGSGADVFVADSANYTIRHGQIAAWLQIAALPTQITLSWPVAATGFVLETSSALVS